MSRFIVLVTLLLLSYFLFSSSAFAAPKINEFYAAGTSSAEPDWVEVYIQGEDITLYQLADEAKNTKDFTGVSCSGNFCTVDWSNRLNAAGDTIILRITSSGAEQDKIAYGSSENNEVDAPTSGQSAGRTTDSTGGWAIFATPTKNSTNNSSTPIPTSTPTMTPTPTPTSAPTSTPTPAATPTPTATPKPTLKPTPTPTPVVLLTQTPKPGIGNNLVLGAQNSNSEPVALSENKQASFWETLKKSPVAVAMIVGGITFLGFAGYSLYVSKSSSGKIRSLDENF